MMTEVKWIKIVTDIFDDEKILLIEAMPEADSIITIWFKLLCLAGKQNNSGVFMLNGRIAYTDEMFATIFRRKLATVRLALKTFEDLGMIEIVEGAVTIPNWAKHQSLDTLEAKREYMRRYMQKTRQRQKLLAENGTKNSGKTNGKTNSEANVSRAEEDIDKEGDKERDKERDINIYGGGGGGNNIPTTLEEDTAATAADKLIAYAANNLKYLSPNNVQELDSFRDSLTDDMIIWAIDEACGSGSRTYNYVKKILNRMVDRGFKTLGEVKAAEEERRRAKEADVIVRTNPNAEDWGDFE